MHLNVDLENVSWVERFAALCSLCEIFGKFLMLIFQNVILHWIEFCFLMCVNCKMIYAHFWINRPQSEYGHDTYKKTNKYYMIVQCYFINEYQFEIECVNENVFFGFCIHFEIRQKFEWNTTFALGKNVWMWKKQQNNTNSRIWCVILCA